MAVQIRQKAKSRLRNTVARYRDARRSLHAPASWQSRYGLDWTNFFIADVQTGFGTFVAFYLAHLGWSHSDIGLVLTVGGVAALVGQIPGGALVDAVTWKRGLLAGGIVATGVAALILALAPSFVMVFVAALLQGLTGGIIAPAITGISLGLVGRRTMSVRTGRNFRYAAGGHAVTAALMGVTGAYFSDSAIFLAAASLCIPALIALAFIRPDEIDYWRARNATKGVRPPRARRRPRQEPQSRAVHRSSGAVPTRRCVAPAADWRERRDHNEIPGADLDVGTHYLPQIVVAALSPWVGYHSERRGRRPLLLMGLALEPLRATCLRSSTNYPFLIVAQVLNGITGAIIGVLTVLVITDLTAGTGRFNLAQGAVGAMSGLAASLSTLATGYLVQAFRPRERVS